jgi:hypothetical protein
MFFSDVFSDVMFDMCLAPVFMTIGNTVYVDHGGYYAGGMVSDVFLEQWACDPVGFLRCLVKGAWMDDQAPGGDGGKFYLLVHQDWCLRKARPVYPMRWIISDLDHSRVDPDFQDGAFLCLISLKHDNLIVAQSGCQPTPESGHSHHCLIVDEATIRHPLHRRLVRAYYDYPIACMSPVRSCLIILAFMRHYLETLHSALMASLCRAGSLLGAYPPNPTDTIVGVTTGVLTRCRADVAGDAQTAASRTEAGVFGVPHAILLRCCHIEATLSMRQAPPPEEELDASTMLHLDVKV